MKNKKAKLVQPENAPLANSQPATKANVSNNKTKQKSSKPNVFKKMGRSFKEMGTELKKVSWPTVGKVVAQTSIVLGVVVIFFVTIGLIDLGLSALFNLLVK